MIVNAAKMLFKRTTIKPIAAFSNGKWKEREDAAENLYVNQTESIYSFTKNNLSRNS
jgi:hypothetical protein